MPVELSTDQQMLQALGRALKGEEDGKKLRRDLTKQLRQALEPARQQARSNLLSVASAGLERDGSPLRATVAQQIKVEARLTGRYTGARIRVPRKRGMPRAFLGAGKALNRPQGWRHPVWGNREVWVEQRATPTEWFDRATTKANPQRYRDAVLTVMNDMAKRLAARAKGG